MARQAAPQGRTSFAQPKCAWSSARWRADIACYQRRGMDDCSASTPSSQRSCMLLPYHHRYPWTFWTGLFVRDCRLGVSFPLYRICTVDVETNGCTVPVSSFSPSSPSLLVIPATSNGEFSCGPIASDIRHSRMATWPIECMCMRPSIYCAFTNSCAALATGSASRSTFSNQCS
jgi:hypothetical protein